MNWMSDSWKKKSLMLKLVIVLIMSGLDLVMNNMKLEDLWASCQRKYLILTCKYIFVG